MLDFIYLLFRSIWNLFCIKWPGFDFPIGAAFIGVSFSVIVLRIIGSLLGISLGSSLSGTVSSARKLDVRISKSREGDEK